MERVIILRIRFILLETFHETSLQSCNKNLMFFLSSDKIYTTFCTNFLLLKKITNYLFLLLKTVCRNIMAFVFSNKINIVPDSWCKNGVRIGVNAGVKVV